MKIVYHFSLMLFYYSKGDKIMLLFSIFTVTDDQKHRVGDLWEIICEFSLFLIILLCMKYKPELGYFLFIFEA